MSLSDKKMKNILKNKIIAKCISVLNEKLEIATTVVNEAQNTANDYGSPKDRYDSFRTQMLQKRDMFAKEVVRINQDLQLIEKIDPNKVIDKVSFGSIVVINNQKLFIGVSIGKIEIEGDIYYGVSSDVPIYKAIKGLKKGDEFEFMGKKNQIIEVI